MKSYLLTGASILITCVGVGCADNSKPATNPSTTSSTRMVGTDDNATSSSNANPNNNTNPEIQGTMPGWTPPAKNTTAGTASTPSDSTSQTNQPGNLTTPPYTPPAGMTPSQPSPPSQASQPSTPPSPATGPDADNTRMNTRDRSSAAVTPMDQGNGQTDLKITQQIRQAVVRDSSLSMLAKNVKIITKDSRVILRGTVGTQAEKINIENKAKAVTGVTFVDNQIDVKQ